MTDRVPGAPGRCKAVVTGEELQKLQAGEEFAITLRRDDQPVKVGTPYSKAAVLPDELAASLCPGVQDPAPKDAFAALLLTRNEIGSVKETFPVEFRRRYDTIDGVEQTLYYDLFIEPNNGNTELSGKTLRIKTYAYGEMVYVVTKDALNDGYESFNVINPDADIIRDPKSGICEFEIDIPKVDFGAEVYAIHILVEFKDNPYIEFEAYEKKDTVWNEIKTLGAMKGGQPGAGGYSPVRGVDYWTETDKAQMVADVIAALPVYNGEVEAV